MSSSYLRIPVRLQSWEETLRRCAGAINWLLDRWASKGYLYGLSITGLSIPAGSPGVVLTGWGGGAESDYVEADPVTGEFTVRQDALYTVSANIIITNGTQNRDYVLEVDVNSATNPLCSAFWAAAQQTALNLSGSAVIPLVRDDILILRLYSDQAHTADVSQGQASLLQVT